MQFIQALFGPHTHRAGRWMPVLLTALIFLAPLGCVDEDFDAPPVGGDDPNLTVTATIAELKAMHALGQYEEVTDDVVIAALVVSNDAAGNFFKQLVIADETGGIELRIDMNDLHNIYPVGRKVYLRARGLWLGDYNGLVQLGIGVGTTTGGDPELTRIPESLIDQFIVPATYGNAVVPREVTLDQLSPDMVSTLVTLKDVQFVTADVGETYADAELQLAVNREIEDCARRRLIVRTSGFATFAGVPTPEGGGSIVGVLSIFRDDYQLLIRDTQDVDMDGDRCMGAGRITLANLRAMFAGGTTTIPSGTVRGVVISDYTTQSVTGRNLYIQDETGGIVLRFTANHSFALGSEIEVDVTGGALGEFSGLLQVDGLAPGAANLLGQPGDVTPRETTVQEVLTNAQAWESTLVRIQDVVLSDNTVFSGSVTVTDATGSMILFTRSQSTFANTAVPTGMVTITAIVSEFNSPQLLIRDADDVSGGGTGGDDDIDESFNSFDDNDDIFLPGWANIAVKGNRLWRAKVFSGNHYAQATAFNDTEPEMESWLITPPIELDVPKKISFESAKAFYEHDGLSVWISSDFNGTDVGAATWQPLGGTLAQASDTDHVFIPSGDVDLSGFSGTVRIGFRYVGSGPGGQTTTWRLDNIKIEDQ